MLEAMTPITLDCIGMVVQTRVRLVTFDMLGMMGLITLMSVHRLVA
ncbi:hypothetical protein phiGrn1_0033 [Vibrio phage phi-Grn1]|uniref:Uncharacterized protein n=1 Tax=Vibrio phage phi-Grn1 TaxID=1747713 RepID=A0A126HH18_9CAUD|nr:hypothetical protein phiGrn1_0033 [Vibrio phage phi-Grn1]